MEVRAPVEHSASRLHDMIAIPGGTFRMGSDKHYPEEAPSHLVTVDEFWMDHTPVTNRQFFQFVAGGGYEQFSLWEPEIWPAVLDFVDRIDIL